MMRLRVAHAGKVGTIVVAERPAQTPAAPVWNVYRERIGQCNTELHKVLRGTRDSVKEDTARPTT